MEVALQEVVRFSGIPIRFRDAVRFPLGLMTDPQGFHHAIDGALAWDVEAVRMLLQECLVHPCAAIGVIAHVLVPYFKDGLSELFVFPWLVLVGQVFVEALAADA